MAAAGAIEQLKRAEGGLHAPLGMVVAFAYDELIANQIFMPGNGATAPQVTITSNFFGVELVPFAVTLVRGAAVEVRHCYCVVTQSEFALPLSEQLQTPGFRTDLGGGSHLVSQSPGT